MRLPATMRPLLGIAATAALRLLLAGSALATGIEVVVSGGGLGFVTVPQASGFDAVMISTLATTTEATLAPFAVRDQRGTGAGWRLQVQALPFADANAMHTLPTGSLTLLPPTVTADGTTSPAPTVSISGEGVAIDVAAPVTVATAPANTGMGTYNVDATRLRLTLPAAAFAATYRSTVTISLVSAPA